MRSESGFYNDGTADAPKLCVYLNLGTLDALPPTSIWHQQPVLSNQDKRLLEDGYEGVQLISDENPAPEATLPYCGLDRISTPSEADAIAAKHAARGDQCLTVHVGWGIEDDNEVSRLVESVLTASQRHALPIFIETHRATVTQDLWRTVQITKTFPEVRFNGDFSHYYCGQELVYGNWSAKLQFMEPIFSRVGFLHGRISSPGCIQVPIDADLAARPSQAHGVVDYLGHFKEFWVLAMRGFLRAAVPGDVLIFAPELLAGTNYYARLFPDESGSLVEETDRYAQALLYKDLAKQCFHEARSYVPPIR